MLILADGAQVAAEDLRDRVRAAALFKQAMWRMSLRAPADLVEQAALAGALEPGAHDEAADKTAARLNLIAEEGEDNWQGKFEDGGLKLVRMVRGVEERAIMDRTLLVSQMRFGWLTGPAGLAKPMTNLQCSGMKSPAR